MHEEYQMCMRDALYAYMYALNDVNSFSFWLNEFLAVYTSIYANLVMLIR